MTIQYVYFNFFPFTPVFFEKPRGSYIRNLNASKTRKLVTHFHSSSYFKFLIDS